MSENQVLQIIANKFKEEMPSKRLLSITLDGFSHSLFYDDGTSESEVKQIFYSGYTPEVKMSELANILFKGVPHSQYQGNAQAFTPIAPEDR